MTPEEAMAEYKSALIGARDATSENMRLLAIIHEMVMECFDGMAFCEEPHLSRYERLVKLGESAVKGATCTTD